MTVLGEQLLLAGGNQVTPARFDLASGKCLTESLDNGNPKANNGRFVRYAWQGGRVEFLGFLVR